ncbi:MAG: TadE/TadG family type IV pilus assembly protein [Candidatus Acidiferrales bacterium]|jgi:Flp pilus assembly protein TadG
MRTRFTDERGTSLLEMALLTPVLLLLLLGIVEVGRYAELSIVVANAARAGVQYGAQSLAAAANTGNAGNSTTTPPTLGTGIIGAATNDAPSALTPSSTNPTPVCVSVWNCNSIASYEQSTCQSPTYPCKSSAEPILYIQVNTTANFSPLFSYPGLPTFLPVNGSAQMQVAQ